MAFPNLPLNYSNLFGAHGLVVEKQGDLMTDIYGLSTCSTTAKCPTTNPSAIPVMFSAHPLYTFLNLERRRVSIENGYYVIQGDYAGVDGTTDPIYELCLGLGEEAITVHPNFPSIAGSPSSPLNGAIFLDVEDQTQISTDDTRGVFDKFTPYFDGGLNPKGGVQSFLDMSQAVWRERYISRSRPGDIAFVGHISFPEGPVPGLGSGQNWLLAGVTYEQRGLCYSVTKEWRASGFRGWDPDIYGF